VPTTSNRFAVAVLVLAGSFAINGCAATAPSLADREFLSVAVTDGGAPKLLAAGTRIRLDFRGTDLGASAGCNSIGGTYRFEGSTLVFEGGSMTEMGCDAERDAQDQWLVQLLGSRPTARLVGDELTLESGSVVVRLRDREVVEPDAALVGPLWTVVSIIGGDAVSSIPDGATATLQFKADGTVDINAGCNQGSGTWATVGSGLQLSAILLTKKACDGVTGALESAVLGVLQSATIAAAIDSKSLTLQAGGQGLQLQAP
jgi:heat shock protein HslJ